MELVIIVIEFYSPLLIVVCVWCINYFSLNSKYSNKYREREDK